MTDPRDRTPAMTSPTTLTTAAEPVVTLEDASFSYGSTTVLTGVTGRVPAGQALALVGPNGSGKTTLMRALLGMVTVSRGRVRVNGAAPGRAPRGSVGYVPQLSDLDPTFPVTVREVVQMGMYSQLGIVRRPFKTNFSQSYKFCHKNHTFLPTLLCLIFPRKKKIV